MLIELDAESRFELASMAYDRWSNAFEAHKKAKQLTWESVNKFCPKNEWPDYHKSMVAEAEKELNKATKLKDAICKYSPLITGE